MTPKNLVTSNEISKPVYSLTSRTHLCVGKNRSQLTAPRDDCIKQSTLLFIWQRPNYRLPKALEFLSPRRGKSSEEAMRIVYRQVPGLSRRQEQSGCQFLPRPEIWRHNLHVLGRAG
ncbi:hypothetical protein AVEN_244515-1 [Araneus ventricosus]|uniref:Uncharacterized protein n=1 Tax=Araneus ventricosus TaxID=182803 RepID=A0A4Y2F4E5_ARAVE|nr:hypothetical protein AVEN_244515-1 [Araneus ventricosus]